MHSNIINKITVSPYTGENKTVHSIRNLVNSNYKDIFIGCYVHGSTGTCEEINYSDFDGLLIVRNKVFGSARLKNKLAKFIRISLKIIYSFDPLQHHGWFLLKESDLENYPLTYFPTEIFTYTKSLHTCAEQTLTITINSSKIDYKGPFNKLVDSIEHKIKNKRCTKNIYQLKSFLSEVMLLPSLYLQAKDKRGIFKKFSFEKAQKDFSPDEWGAIEIASDVRLNWIYKLNSLQRVIMTQHSKVCRKLTKNIIAPKVPEQLKQKVNNEFYANLEKLISKMNSMIDAS